MKLLLSLMLTAYLLGEAVLPAPANYLETHISADEIGIQCRAEGKMSTRKLANMLIVSCAPEHAK